MPRVAQAPQLPGETGTTTTTTQQRRATSRQILSTPHKAPPAKFQLNDDRVEKAERLKSRQALREIEQNEMRAAAVASPMRKQRYEDLRDGSESPQTPRRVSSNNAGRRAAAANATNSPGAIKVVSHGATVTPLKRAAAPILANFEEWMKMATDNKINAANSWNFALIDYFHDMSLLKEGDGRVNFQKASCTLDGCVKIYTSRVDSVSTEAGRLLSGLAESRDAEGKKKRKGDGEDGEDGEEEEGDEEGEDDDEDGSGMKKKAKKKAARSHEATLAPSFASLQLRKLELEFAVDPLFKKASADFDEGGAKGLLLNHLSIDGEGRIVFDSSDDAGAGAGDGTTPALQKQKTAEEGDDDQEDGSDDLLEATKLSVQEHEQDPVMEGDADIDLDGLTARFFPDLSILDNQDICPSMKTFTLGSSSNDMSLPFLKAPDDWKSPNKQRLEQLSQQPPHPRPDINLNLADATGIFLDGSHGFDDENNDDAILGGLDLDADNIGFGEGGEAWAKDAALEPMLRVTNGEADSPNENDGEEVNGPGYTFAMSKDYQEDAAHLNILSYFDKTFNSKRGRAQWTKQVASASSAAEYWRVAKIQMQQQQQLSSASGQNTTEAAKKREKKEKEPFEIDFLSPMSEELSQLLAQPPATNASITLPRAQWRTKGRNLLEVGEGERVDSKMMGRLWLKPRCVIVREMGGKIRVREEERWNQTTPDADAGGGGDNRDSSQEADAGGRKGDYDANFFADDFGGPANGFDVPLPIDDDEDDFMLADDGMGVTEEDNDSQGQLFLDAREMLSPPPPGLLDSSTGGAGAEGQATQQMVDPFAPGSFGSQLVNGAGGILGAKKGSLRPEFVNYARVAKKVDVRRLKEELWKGMLEGFERVNIQSKAGSRRQSSNDEQQSGDDDSAGPPTPRDPNENEGVDVEMLDADNDAPKQQQPGAQVHGHDREPKGCLPGAADEGHQYKLLFYLLVASGE